MEKQCFVWASSPLDKASFMSTTSNDDDKKDDVLMMITIIMVTMMLMMITMLAMITTMTIRTDCGWNIVFESISLRWIRGRGGFSIGRIAKVWEKQQQQPNSENTSQTDQ